MERFGLGHNKFNALMKKIIATPVIGISLTLLLISNGFMWAVFWLVMVTLIIAMLLIIHKAIKNDKKEQERERRNGQFNGGYN